MPNKTFLWCVALLVGAAMVGGCARDADLPGETDVAVPEAGVVIRQVPAGLRVVRGDDGRVALEPDRGEGRITFAMSPPVEGVLDPLEPARDVQAEIEALSSGRFFGSQELRTPLGRAFTARGRFEARGVTMEEIRVLSVHPWGDRFLTVSSVHPAGEDTAERMHVLLDVFAELAEGERGAS